MVAPLAINRSGDALVFACVSQALPRWFVCTIRPNHFQSGAIVSIHDGSVADPVWRLDGSCLGDEESATVACSKLEIHNEFYLRTRAHTLVIFPLPLGLHRHHDEGTTTVAL